ncbi:ParB/RepB/Spo0J family partition protein [Cellulomonas shaoxiangyii]|uniref:ParB/RepB/Spo0J family partition protein n=1 Tax=Cellulomonas shaoxiangyii TaxID=2566013 RepID=A0A4P7SP60_9CELL|nr:ParB/RepB/Spo0J family partition protein [Cellulomonas shaoxiangyii]QCB95056.1 ParB/RepB/Spo0J family partition protein [Cellulomonas shaoxiangyii]TGY86385.1 ParB/RepB/Spo0J family partition protein [Cellulomonas shaoxiangyii]
MSEKRRGLGRGLGALIPTGLDQPRSTAERPVDVFFPDTRKNAAAADDAAAGTSPQVADADAGATRPDASGTDGTPTSAAVANGDGDAVPGPAAAEGDGASAGSGAPDAATTSPDARTGADDGLVPVPGARFAELPVDAIRPNPRQPRSVFDEDALAELVGSIQEVGVLQPVVVRQVGDAFELIMGERRWRATQEAGLATIPAIVRDTDDSDLLRDALLENLHRAQLNPLEEAAAYQQLLDDFGCTHEELATRIHRSRPQISNTLRLLRLPPLVQRRLAAGVISAGHARALLGLADGAAIERLAQRIVSEGLSVRAVEEIVALGGDEAAPTRRPRPRAGVRNEALDDLASRLSDRFETRVKVDLGKTRGKLTVEFASVQDLNRILSSLAPDDPGLLRR